MLRPFLRCFLGKRLVSDCKAARTHASEDRAVITRMSINAFSVFF
jgi:hypothetical protein